jgi:hypothetical protein
MRALAIIGFSILALRVRVHNGRVFSRACPASTIGPVPATVAGWQAPSRTACIIVNEIGEALVDQLKPNEEYLHDFNTFVDG